MCICVSCLQTPKKKIFNQNRQKTNCNMGTGLGIYQAVRACCLPAGTTLTSCIPVGISIIQKDHSVFSQLKCYVVCFYCMLPQSNSYV